MKRIFDVLVSWGPPGLFGLAVIDGAGLPMPGGVDLIVIFLAARAAAPLWMLALIAVLGSTLGNLILFSLARKGGEEYLRKHTLSRFGKKVREWFQHYGLVGVFIVALVPLPVMPTKIFVICAGALGTTIRSFALVFGSARVLRYLGLAYLGGAMGENAPLFLRLHVRELVLFSVALFLACLLLVKVTDARRARLTASR